MSNFGPISTGGNKSNVVNPQRGVAVPSHRGGAIASGRCVEILYDSLLHEPRMQVYCSTIFPSSYVFRFTRNPNVLRHARDPIPSCIWRLKVAFPTPLPGR